MNAPVSLRVAISTFALQLGVTLALSLVAGFFLGVNVGISMALGGVVNALASAVFSVLAMLGQTGSAMSVVRSAVRAEMGKIIVIVLALWWVFHAFPELIGWAFTLSFIVTLLVSRVPVYLAWRQSKH